MRFERTSLSKRFLTKIALVRTNTCMCSSMSFQIKRIIESFTTEGTQVSFCIRMTFHMSIQKSLKAKHFCAQTTLKLCRIRFGSNRSKFFICRLNLWAYFWSRHWVFNSVSSIYDFDWHVGWYAKPLRDNLNPHLQRWNIAYIFFIIGSVMDGS